MSWLRQFPSNLGDGPLQLLEELRLVGRQDVVGALNSFLASNEGAPFGAGALCPLGEPKDSSAVTTYWAGDGQRHNGLEVRSLGDALAKPDVSIVFMEDFIGSGQQSVSILEAWLDTKPTTNLRESRGPLSSAAAQQLRERKLGFVFAAGRSAGVKLLSDRAAELGLDIEVRLGNESAPKAFDGHDGRDELKEFCRRVGHELLLHHDRGHDDEWVAERALGFGNEAFLVLFGYNTPSQTLTCIWQDGTFENVPWMALFPRRRKR